MRPDSITRDCVRLCEESYRHSHGVIGGSLEILQPHKGILCFRGSDETLDWVTNFRFAPVWIKDLGWVHRGFWREIERNWEELRPFLSEGMVLTGHSKGAATAQMVAAFMAIEGMKPARVEAFAPPRVGGKTFGDLVRDNLRIYRHGGDIVTHVPLPGLYWHAVTPRQLGEDRRKNWPDHLIPHYVREIEAVVGGG